MYLVKNFAIEDYKIVKEGLPFDHWTSKDILSIRLEKSIGNQGFEYDVDVRLNFEKLLQWYTVTFATQRVLGIDDFGYMVCEHGKFNVLADIKLNLTMEDKHFKIDLDRWKAVQFLP